MRDEQQGEPQARVGAVDGVHHRRVSLGTPASRVARLMT
jgi:hypothetical protein